MSAFLEACEEARSYASIELDQELPELDAARLRAHLKTCAACELWVARAGAVAGLLREAELQEPKPLSPVAIPREHFRFAGAVGGVAASVAAVGFAVVAVTLPSTGRSPARQKVADGVAPPAISCASCDVARLDVHANFASATAPVSRASRRRHYPGPI